MSLSLQILLVVLFSLFVSPLFLFYTTLQTHPPILAPSQTVSLTILHNYRQIYCCRIYEINTPMPQFNLCHFLWLWRHFLNKTCLRTTDLQQEELWILHLWVRRVILTHSEQNAPLLPAIHLLIKDTGTNKRGSVWITLRQNHIKSQTPECRKTTTQKEQWEVFENRTPRCVSKT